MNALMLKFYLIFLLNFILKLDCLANVINIQNRSSKPLNMKLFKFNGNRLVLVDSVATFKDSIEYKIFDTSDNVENYYLQYDSVTIRFMYLNEIEININVNDSGCTISTPLNSILSYPDEGRLLQHYFENRIVNSKDSIQRQSINDIKFVLLNPNKSDSASLIKSINLFYCNFNEPEVRTFLFKDSKNAIPYLINNCKNITSLRALYYYFLELFQESYKDTCRIYSLILIDQRAFWLNEEEKTRFGNQYKKYCRDE